MPDFTPEYDFPYPTGVESPNGPGAFRALAEAVETELLAQANPSFTNVTYNGAWTDFGSTFEEVSYAKVGTVVYLRGTAKHGTPATTGLIFTLPEDYRPTKDRLYMFIANAGFARCTISSAGAVTILSYISSGTGASISFDGFSFDTAA
jgi:hypothetical protein